MRRSRILFMAVGVLAIGTLIGATAASGGTPTPSPAPTNTAPCSAATSSTQGWACFATISSGGVGQPLKGHAIATVAVPSGLTAQSPVSSSALKKAAAATQSSQCNMPVKSRKGAWTCQNPTPKISTLRTAAAGDTMWCNVSGGCWTVGANRANASFIANNIVFGYGKDELGNVSVIIDWVANGKQIKTSTVQIKNSFPTTSNKIDCWIENGNTNVDGALVSAVSAKIYGGKPAGITTVGTKGLCDPVEDGGSWDLEHVMEADWTSIGYPGHWYVKIKSPVIHTPDKHSYFFNTHEDLPGTPASAGWV